MIRREKETTRLETFVDAAFAFALTMLVVSIDAVPQSYAELVEAIKRVPAFAASFAIVVMFWHAHYRCSRRFGVEDGGAVLLSLALVFLVLVFLYPLRLMMSGAFNALSLGWLPGELRLESAGQLRFVFVLYGLAFALMAGTLCLQFARVRRLALDPPLSVEDRAVSRVETQVWGILSVTGIASALLALVLPAHRLAIAVWLYACLGVVMPLMGRRWTREIEAAVAPSDAG